MPRGGGETDATTVGDRPEAYLAEDRQRAVAAGVDMREQVAGAALFADISGFTPLTEALAVELGPRRGAEHLSDILERVFGHVLGALHRYGGSVIYFSGDAVTCWIDGDDGPAAVNAALAMQAAMAEVATVALPSGRTVGIGMKVSIAVGSARRFVVGDPDVQLIDVLAGSLIDRLAAAEQHAASGEIVAGAELADRLAERVEVAGLRGEAGAQVAVLTAWRGAAVPTSPDDDDRGALPDDAVRPWLLPAVYERLRAGRGEFLAELRPAVPLFLRFGGIDYDHDPAARDVLDEFVTRAQAVIDSYGGNLLQLTLGDKGAYLYAVFGSPIAHEDDAARACAAALELRELDRQTSVEDIQIGIASGRLRSGTYGHVHRRTFCCLGDAVNLAARLMSAAPPGEVFVDPETYAAARDRFEWLAVPELQLKGKSTAVAAQSLITRRRGAAQQDQAEQRAFVGRSPELALLAERMRLTDSGTSQVVGVMADAGMGKSRLLAAAFERDDVPMLRRVHGVAPSFGAAAAYRAWQDVARELFGLGADDADAAGRLPAVLAELGADLLPRLPLLAAVLGLDVADNALTATFDAKLRKTSTEQLMGECVRRLAAREPLALVIEDCHWFDALSADLLEAVVRAVAAAPVLVLLAYRPPLRAGDLDWRDRLAATDAFVELSLAELSPADAGAVTTDRYRHAFGTNADAPQALLDLVVDRCEGNPFHIEELVGFVRAQGVDPADTVELARLDVPASLNSLVLSRIDILTEAPRRTVKVASVIGREFHLATLAGTYPQLGDVHEIAANVVDLQALNMVLQATGSDDARAFRHAVIRDVAYEATPFAMRESLHENAAAYFEASADGAPPVDLLAYHYARSANVDKKREYLLRAGDAAQAAYANAAAIDYFEHAAPLLDGADRAAVLLKLGKVRELLGEWDAARSAYDAALAIADDVTDTLLRARTRTAQAELDRRQGRFDDAAAALDEARTLFTSAHDDAGLGQVLHQGGTLAAQRGNYAEARHQYGASLRLREASGDLANVAALYSNLAIVAEYEDDLDGARYLAEQALQLRRGTGNPWAIGISQNNLGLIRTLQGDLDGARDCFAESMQLHSAVGDLWMVAMGHNNLGNVLRRSGELAEAGRQLAEGLTGYRRFDDRWAIAILFEDIAAYAVAVGRPDTALVLDGAAQTLREQLGSPRSPAQQGELDVLTASGRTELGDEAVEQLVARGRSLSASAADDVAIEVCAAEIL